MSLPFGMHGLDWTGLEKVLIKLRIFVGKLLPFTVSIKKNVSYNDIIVNEY